MALKVCYIWVENYRNFNNFGVNFSSTEKFHFDRDSGVLSLEKLETLPYRFFENDRVLDVTGVIGKNGTGKSNLLELICSLLKGGRTSMDETFLVVIQKNGSYECHSSSNFTTYTNQIDIQLMSYNKGIDPLKVVYFSNVYDEREHYFDSKVSNLSGNLRYKTSKFSSKKTSTFVKQLQFVRSHFMDISEIPYPREISVSIKKINLSQRIKRMTFLTTKSYALFELNLKEFYGDVSRLRHTGEKLRIQILFSLILDFINLMQFEIEDANTLNDRLHRITDKLNDSIDQVEFKTKSKLAISNLWNDWLRESVNEIAEWKISQLNFPENLYKSILQLQENLVMLNRFDDLTNSISITPQTEGSRNRKVEKYIIPFRQEPDKLEESYYNYFDKDPKFVMNWLGLSSGHKAYLDFFSLLWFELKSIRTENVIVCIDEGDLYLHPMWQADFFYKVISVIPEFKNVNFQFILTSHSPFLVSDLPSESLIFLTTGEDEQHVMVADNSDIKTFGGNLGDLYIDAFFMDGSLISRFAAKKIQALVNKINKKEKLTINDVKLINLIGEDLIRLQIENLINDPN
ncbi:AAA family ATPase [Flagellimonas sp.]|uniref:AAA family ATPase n=1 Tax=Flagellimonas sp. TaxID=2058762 RepID=UPI003AB4239A